jgi:Tol biopolymer transport system component
VYGCGGICFVNVDGTGQTRLTPAAAKSQTSDRCIRDSDPTWSPNGSTIAFTRWPDVAIPTSMCLSLGTALSFPFDFWTQVWLIEADGSNLRPLKDRRGNAVTYAGWPSWSRDGRRLAFYYANASEEAIGVASADTSGFVTIVHRNPPLWNSVLGSPAWSPDGSQVVFSTSDGWGFADASGADLPVVVKSPIGVVPNSLSWSWSPR